LEKFSMKKTLIALAAVAATGAAFAQATISGNLTGFYQSASSSDKGLVLDTAKITVSASEDLGGGLKASAYMNFAGSNARQADSGVNSEDAELAISGGFGSVAFKTYESGNLFEGFMSGATSSVTDQNSYDLAAKHGNTQALRYTAPTFAGITAFVQITDTTATRSNASNGESTAVSATYANGPVKIAGAYVSYSDNYTSSTDAGNAGLANNLINGGNKRELGASYDLGVAKLGVGYRKLSYLSNSTTNFSIAVPVGAATIGADQVKYNNVKLTAVGATYAMSKRTSVGVSTNKWTGANSDVSQYRVSLSHSF
jgi:predicted porin